jgi:hypothetical protein
VDRATQGETQDLELVGLAGEERLQIWPLGPLGFHLSGKVRLGLQKEAAGQGSV